jgi:hypothetical protein
MEIDGRGLMGLGVLMLMENWGGLVGSQRQFGGVHVRIVYIFHPNDSSFFDVDFVISCVGVVFIAPGSDCRAIALLPASFSASVSAMIQVDSTNANDATK